MPPSHSTCTVYLEKSRCNASSLSNAFSCTPEPLHIYRALNSMRFISWTRGHGHGRTMLCGTGIYMKSAVTGTKRHPFLVPGKVSFARQLGIFSFSGLPTAPQQRIANILLHRSSQRSRVDAIEAKLALLQYSFQRPDSSTSIPSEYSRLRSSERSFSQPWPTIQKRGSSS